MSQPIIEVKNLGKKYNITHQQGGYIALRDVLAYILKKPFSFLKTKAKSMVGASTKEEFWALRGVDFSIDQGEVIGIIGANGAGKSTLLKILTGITPPTEGEVVMRGRVASLLEVGTGFHPELTGRENIFLNGAILGMTRKEIAKKFDDIVEFAGVTQFLDTPVKYYSSGMYVRLAFSVAAHMEPDILLVDEVLAVGDAEFQKKCLGKMEEVTKKSGRTILFISHNMGAIQNLCKKTIFLKKGRIEMFGKTDDVIRAYLEHSEAVSSTEFQEDTEKSAQIRKIQILDANKNPTGKVPISQKFFIKIDYVVRQPIKQALLYLWFYSRGEILLSSSSADKDGVLRDYEPGQYSTLVEIPAFLFNVGYYYFDVRFQKPFIEDIDYQLNLSFEVSDVRNPVSEIFHGNNAGRIATILEYHTEK